MALRAYNTVVSRVSPLDWVEMDIRHADLVAPCGVMLGLKNVPMHVYLTGGFVWTFYDDEAANPYENLNVDHLFRSTGRAKKLGPKASRSFQTAGLKQWSVTIYYQDYEPVTLTGSVNITETIDDVYSEADTFYLSSASDFPAGAINTYTTWADLETDVQAADRDVRIRVKSGEDHEKQFVYINNSGFNMVFDTYGGDTKAQLHLDPTLLNGDVINVAAQNLKVINLRLYGGLDPSEETGTDAAEYRAVVSVWGGEDRVIFMHDVETQGLHHGIYTADDNAPNDHTYDHSFVYISELNTIDRGNFGVFVEAELIALEGCNLDQVADARGGGRPKGTLYSNVHGPVRIPRALWYISNCGHMYSPHGWGTGVGVPNHQGCQRLLTSGNPGCESVTTQNQFESGSPVISHDTSAGADWCRDWIGRHVFHHNYVIGTANVPQHMNISFPAHSVMNNIFYMPNVPMEGGDSFQAFVADRLFLGNPNGEDVGYAPIIIRGNTFALMCPDASINLGNFNWVSDFSGSGFRNVDVGDNLMYAPNIVGSMSNPPPVDYSPLDTSTVLTPKYPGLKYWDQPTLDTTYATPTEGAALFQPQAGSPAIGAASVRLELDFWGNPRSETTSIGAFDGAA